MTRESYTTLAAFLVQTLQILIARNVGVGIHAPHGDGTTDVEFHLGPGPNGPGTATRLTLATEDCQNLIDAPTSGESLDLLELVVHELGVNMDDVNIAEEFYAARAAAGLG